MLPGYSRYELRLPGEHPIVKKDEGAACFRGEALDSRLVLVG